MKEKTADKFLTVQTTAETLGCTDQYIYILIQQGSLRAIKLGERALRVSNQSLQDFIASRTVNPDDYFAPKEPPSKQIPEPKKPSIARSNWMTR